MLLNISDYLQINYYKIYNSKVKTDIKIASLSDIHISRLVLENKTAYLNYRLEIEQPDYICLIGDIIDSPKELKNKDKQNQTTEFVEKSSKIAPTIMVLGNHDFISRNKYLSKYAKKYWKSLTYINNFYLLNNSYYKDDNIFIMGCKQTKNYYSNLEKEEDTNLLYSRLIKNEELYKNLPTAKPTIGLFHSPEYIKNEKIVNLLSDYDLLMSGHYHGGCFPLGLGNIIPGNRGLISPKKTLLPKTPARGITTLNTDTKLIVNSGITTIQDSAPKYMQPFNHLFYQEMDIITLTNNKEIFPYQLTRKKVYTKKKNY